MAWPTWVPPQLPSQQGTNMNVTPRLIDSQFGDGYHQVVFDGLNYLDGQATLSYSQISSSAWGQITAWAAAHITSPFLWTLPGETVARQWRATKWSYGFSTSTVVQGAQLILVLDFTPG